MALKTIYATALAAAFAAFAVAGGIHASERAVVAVERQEARVHAPAIIHPVDTPRSPAPAGPVAAKP
ncbi:MAG TPA: hypothetical protein VF475_05745 [Sphingobium sp.]